MRLLLTLSRVRARLARRESIYLGVWLAVLVATEIAGRGAGGSDGEDLLGVMAWGALVAVTLLDHARQPLRFVGLAGLRLRRLVRRLPLRTLSVGFDLRERPRLPEGLPRGAESALGTGFVVVAVLFALRGTLPLGLRTELHGLSPTLWYWVLGLTWALVGSCCVALGQALHLLAEPRLRELSPRTRGLVGALGVGTVGTCALYLSPALPVGIALVGVALVLAGCALPGNARLRLVFRSAEDDAPCTLDWTQVHALGALAGTLAASGVVLVTLGDPFESPGAAELPITSFLGRLFAWLVGGAGIVWTYEVLERLRLARRDDPSGPDVPRLLLTDVAPAERADCARLVRAAGLEPVFRAERALSTDLRATWGEERRASERVVDGDRLRVAPALLADELFLRVVTRRHRLVCRERLRTGLARMFRVVEGSERDEGCGWWVAPHLWFFEGLRRDTDRGGDALAEPAFRDVLPRTARRHLHAVLRALEVDLLFVEDGLRPWRFERVLERLFEHFDEHEGTRRLEEHDLNGLPGVRAVLHDYEYEPDPVDDALRRPDYRMLGRARILHLFRERGGDVARPSTPVVSDRVPDVLPTLV